MIARILTGCLALTVLAGRAAEPPEAVLDRSYLAEIVRHLYRWQLDERDVEAVPGMTNLAIWVRSCTPELDPGDRSEFAEILLPAFAARVTVKKADYAIEETGTAVKSRGFRIVHVARPGLSETPPAGAQVRNFAVDELRAHLFATRTNAEFPSAALFERLRAALRKKMLAGDVSTPPAEGVQTVFLAPLSPVANEWWVFWENRKLLIRFTSDVDLANEEVWQHEELRVDTYDCLNQVVVSMDEAPGSNEFLTRDRIGRAMYNCIVLGKRLDVTPKPESGR